MVHFDQRVWVKEARHSETILAKKRYTSIAPRVVKATFLQGFSLLFEPRASLRFPYHCRESKMRLPWALSASDRQSSTSVFDAGGVL